MNEICKNTFRIWRFWKKNFQVWVLPNNSYLDRLKNIMKTQIFSKNENSKLVYELKFAQELIPDLIKSKIDVWKHIAIPWSIVYLWYYNFHAILGSTTFLHIQHSKFVDLDFKLCFRFISWWGVTLSVWDFSNMFWSYFSLKRSHYFCVFSLV